LSVHSIVCIHGPNCRKWLYDGEVPARS